MQVQDDCQLHPPPNTHRARNDSRWAAGSTSLFEPRGFTVYPFSPFFPSIFNWWEELQPEAQQEKLEK